MKVFYPPDHARHRTSVVEYDEQLIYEKPERVEAILRVLKEYPTSFSIFACTEEFPMEIIARVHTSDYLAYLKTIWPEWKKAKTTPQVIPDTFYVRTLAKKRPGSHHWSLAGFYCFDRLTPIVSAFCAVRAADELLRGSDSSTYALCRPPGHHAGSDLYGGWCYLNNAAIAARRLQEFDIATGQNSANRRVAILDVDYHHGNGTQAIFYDCAQIYYVSIHADPEQGGEPHFIGYKEEIGEEAGTGHNLNFSLAPEGVTDEEYAVVLKKAVKAVATFAPDYLVVSLGCDIMAQDGVGNWLISTEFFGVIGAQVAELHLPTLVVHEGGYNIDKLGHCVKNFLLPFATRKKSSNGQ